MITDIILIIGIETKCGMIGLGVIQGGILGVLLIDGHHLDMIDGDMESTMVGITTDGDIMGTMVMDGIIITGGTITVKMVGTEDEVEIMCRISTVEEVVL
jgi:urea transporter